MRMLLSMAVLLAVVVLAYAGMIRAWQRRTDRTTAVVAEPLRTFPPRQTPPTGAGPAQAAGPTAPGADRGPALTEPVDVTYVSSTTAGQWLDRVTAHGMGVPSVATVHVHERGVLIERPAVQDMVIPREAIQGVELAPGVAGKVVGHDGLVVVRWESEPGDRDHPPLVLDTGLHPRLRIDRDRLLTAVRRLVDPPAEVPPAEVPPTDLPPAQPEEQR